MYHYIIERISIINCVWELIISSQQGEYDSREAIIQSSVYSVASTAPLRAHEAKYQVKLKMLYSELWRLTDCRFGFRVIPE